MMIQEDPRQVKARKLSAQFWKIYRNTKHGPRGKITRAIKIAHAKQVAILLEIGDLIHTDAFIYVNLFRNDARFQMGARAKRSR